MARTWSAGKTPQLRPLLFTRVTALFERLAVLTSYQMVLYPFAQDKL